MRPLLFKCKKWLSSVLFVLSANYSCKNLLDLRVEIIHEVNGWRSIEVVVCSIYYLKMK